MATKEAQIANVAQQELQEVVVHIVSQGNIVAILMMRKSIAPDFARAATSNDLSCDCILHKNCDRFQNVAININRKGKEKERE